MITLVPCSCLPFNRGGFREQVLDFTHLGSSLSLRSFARLGSSIAVHGLARFGSVFSFSMLDFVLPSPLQQHGRREIAYATQN